MPAKQTRVEVIQIAIKKLKLESLGDVWVKEFINLFDSLNDSDIRNECNRIFARMVLGDDPNNLKERYYKIKLLSKAHTLEKCVLTYGINVGTNKWNEYRRRQAETNTFEYKNKKYGISKEEFDIFNKSRSTTLENLVSRHGIEEGNRLWEKYCKRQQYAGCKLEYFIEKHGKDEGQKIYNELNKKKAQTLENYIRKYGENGLSKYEERIDSALTYYSKISQELFVMLEEKLTCEGQDTTKIYYATKNKEFGKIYKNTYKKFDFVDTSRKIVIEFNGDDWHANPKKYMPNQEIKIKGKAKIAKEIWENDREKNKIMTDLGYNVIIVWESDFKANRKYIVEKLYDELHRNK